jgi:uncharacterized protein YbdZ (MbtH family)
MARSSRGEDARFSFWKQGFDSPTGYEKAASIRSGFFCLLHSGTEVRPDSYRDPYGLRKSRFYPKRLFFVHFILKTGVHPDSYRDPYGYTNNRKLI